jgi:hypothetical protein
MSIAGIEKRLAHDGAGYCAMDEIDGPHVLTSAPRRGRRGAGQVKCDPSRTIGATCSTRCASRRPSASRRVALFRGECRRDCR